MQKSSPVSRKALESAKEDSDMMNSSSKRAKALDKSCPIGL